MERHPLLEHPLGVKHLLGLDRDVGSCPTDPARGLVHHDPGVWQREPLPGGAGAEQQLAHGRRHAHRHRRHVIGDELHGVVNRHARVDRATGRVHVQPDIPAVILRGEQQQLRADPIGDLVIDLAAEEDDPLAEQAVEDGVVEIQAGRVRATRVGKPSDRRPWNVQVGHGSPSQESGYADPSRSVGPERPKATTVRSQRTRAASTRSVLVIVVMIVIVGLRSPVNCVLGCASQVVKRETDPVAVIDLDMLE